MKIITVQNKEPSILIEFTKSEFNEILYAVAQHYDGQERQTLGRLPSTEKLLDALVRAEKKLQ
jgi:hypothetical protein